MQQLGAEDGGEWIQSRLQQFARQCMNAATMAQVSPARAKLAKKKQMELRKQAAEEKEKESQGKDLQVEGKVSKDMMLKFFAKNEEVLTSSEVSRKSMGKGSTKEGEESGESGLKLCHNLCEPEVMRGALVLAIDRHEKSFVN